MDSQGFGCYCRWIPNKQDIEALVAGRPLFFESSGQTHPPLALFTIEHTAKEILNYGFI
jgi:hypothetical protein